MVFLWCDATLLSEQLFHLKIIVFTASNGGQYAFTYTSRLGTSNSNLHEQNWNTNIFVCHSGPELQCFLKVK